MTVEVIDVTDPVESVDLGQQIEVLDFPLSVETTDATQAFDLIDVTPVAVELMDVIAGPPGPAGPPSAGWLHEQLSPLASWTIAHPFGRIPAVQFNVGGYPTDAPCSVTATHVYVTWPYPVAGVAILS